jgi:hypothetical protein
VSVKFGALFTVNTAEQVEELAHELVTVNTTVVVPPQKFGAPELLLVTTGLQPPVTFTVESHVANLESMSA